MAGSLNKVSLIGNLGKDPEIRSTSDGEEIASFSIATTEALVGIVKNYIKKGSKLYIEGQLQTRKWVDNNGQERYTTEVVLQGFNASLILLDGKAGAFTDTNTNNNLPNFDNSELDDEIPF